MFSKNLLFDIAESDAAKDIGHKSVNNNAVIIASGVIRTSQYTQIEHLIARFQQITNAESEIHLYIIGSRNGVEWKILNGGVMKQNVNRGGIEIRRTHCSSRYYQFVFIKKDIGNTLNTKNRRESYFDSFEFSTLPHYDCQ